MSMPDTTLAGNSVGRIGYGLMMLTWTPKPPPQEDSFAAMKAAADAGCTAWSTAMFYGQPGDPTANIELLAAFFKKYPQYQNKITLVVKGGINETFQPVADVDVLRCELKKCQSILGDKKIDVYSYARLPKDEPVEKVFGRLKTLKDEGLFTAVGASEMNAESLKKAHAIVPIATIEIEVSLWSYEPDIQAVLAWSRDTSVPVFCYSPLGRGFISRTYKSPDDIPDGLFIKGLPRFQGEAFYENLKLVDKLDEMAEKKGVTTPQLALAWILSLSAFTIPIPGSSNPKRIKENADAASAVELTPQDLAAIDEILASFQPKGGRYPGHASAHLMQ